MTILLAAADSGGKAGPIGLLVILALAVASYFLFRSMTNQMKKVPPSFDEPDASPPAATDATAAPDATAATDATDDAVESGDDRA